VIAEPYSRRSCVRLSHWAQSTHAELVQPAIPASRVVATGNDNFGVTISVDPTAKSQAGAPWLTYSMTSALWRESKFNVAYPDEHAYRHSLVEEVEALNLTRLVAGEQARRANDHGDLAYLAADDMLAPFVLICAPDPEISKDYAAYRVAHRHRLRTYLDRYVVDRARWRAGRYRLASKPAGS
jgi:hypothetical protein